MRASKIVLSLPIEFGITVKIELARKKQRNGGL